MTPSTPSLPNWLLAALAAPAMPMAALTLPLIIYLPAYYANTLEVNLSLVGMIFTLVRLADLAFDPFIGALMDRTRTRWGQFRPWLFLGAPLVMTGTWMLFMAEKGVGPLYLSGGLALAYMGYSIVILSQMGMGTTITPDYRERSRVFAWWQMSNTAGLILALLMPVIFAERVAQNSGFAVHAMGWLVVIMVPLTCLICLVFVREAVVTKPPAQPSWEDYLSLFSLSSTRLILAAQLLIGLGLGVSASVFLFFFTMLKQVSFEYVGLQLAGTFIVAIIAAPFWSTLANRIGKHRALMFGSIGFACYMLFLLAMPVGNLWYFFLVGIPGGVVSCAADMLPRSIMADVSDEERFVHGVDRTGTLFALLVVTHKFGQAMSIGLVYFALDLIGFKPGSVTNGASVLGGVAVLYAVVPALLFLLAGLTIGRFRLTQERHAEIRKALEARGVLGTAIIS